MCDMMKDRLNKLGITYCLCMDTDAMLTKGIKHVPVIEDEDGAFYHGKAALDYINSRFAKETQ